MQARKKILAGECASLAPLRWNDKFEVTSKICESISQMLNTITYKVKINYVWDRNEI